MADSKLIKKALYERDKGICQLCLLPANYIECNIDHILPKTRGGLNNIDNLQISHIWCNNIKGNSIRVHVPEYYINHVQYGKVFNLPKSKKVVKLTGSRYPVPAESLQDSKRKSVNTDQPRLLWNEIATNGLTKLSYTKFKNYFNEHLNINS